MKVYRIQAKDGRGPFRPGLTNYWLDVVKPELRPIQEEFGTDWLSECRRGWMYGTGCKSLSDLAAWFTPSKRVTLAVIGYSPVEIVPDTIVRAGERQLIFGCKRTFAEVAKPITWGKLP